MFVRHHEPGHQEHLRFGKTPGLALKCLGFGVKQPGRLMKGTLFAVLAGHFEEPFADPNRNLGHHPASFSTGSSSRQNFLDLRLLHFASGTKAGKFAFQGEIQQIRLHLPFGIEPREAQRSIP